jgi:ComF family protein
MIDTLMAFVAPHYCCGCEKTGTLLCGNCKYDIISEPFSLCLAWGKSLAGPNGICSICKVSYQRAWCVADRRDHLECLIDNYKFTNVRAAYRPLTDLLDARLPDLPANTVIVPVPTVSNHIRQRGYDHMLLIAQHLAKLRSLTLHTGLQRVTSTRQRSAGRAARIAQAKKAFTHPKPLDPTNVYLLVDDVVTTGATMQYAAKTLLDAGAKTVWVASISRQPLD